MNDTNIEKELEEIRQAKKTPAWVICAEIGCCLLMAMGILRLIEYMVVYILERIVQKSYGDSGIEDPGIIGKIILWFVFSAAAGLGFYLVYRWSKNRVRSAEAKYKRIITERAAEGMFNKLSHSEFEGFEKAEIKRTGLVKMRGRYRSNGLISGSYKNVSFRRADVELGSLVSLINSKPYLLGSWSIFKFKKKFRSGLQIFTKDFQAADTDNTSEDAPEFKKRRKLRTDDERFNRVFSVYGEDNPETASLLTPRLTEALFGMYQMLGCPMMVGIVGNKLHVVIHSVRKNVKPSGYANMFWLQNEIETARNELKAMLYIADMLENDREDVLSQNGKESVQTENQGVRRNG